MTSMMDEGCEKKRINFEGISSAMYTILKKSRVKECRHLPTVLPDGF